MARTIDGLNYTTHYQLNVLGQTAQITFPSGRVLVASYDNKARLSSIANLGAPTYLSNVGYDVNGNYSGWTLGNGVREAFGFDTNRLQPTLHTAGTTSPYTNIMNVSYSYQASAGQMGAGSTAGNAGQLTSFSGTISVTTESGAYSFDNLGRLVTSNQTSNGSSAQRRFAYDRWGNRTGVWDATSGGNQIQSVTLQQSGGAPTNRIQSVTAGSTVNYVYDANGNVTSDGAHSYSYDAENRLVSVDGGVTGQYAYDHQNRRMKKTAGGATTHYVWEGSQVLAEHNGSSGAVTTDYVYLGGKLIARIASGSTQFILNDRMSPRLLLDSSGNVLGRQGHLPFGDDFGESGSQEKHHLTSYERDGETQYDYAVNRVYSAPMGRFLSADPYSPSSCTNDPRGWNRYSYTRNVVINRADLLGLQDGGVQGDCQPLPGSGFLSGSRYPGKCLCQLVPAACASGIKPGYPPNVDGNSGGPGGSITPPGSLKVQSSCQNVVYLPEEPAATKPSDWGPPQDNIWQDSDAVATPRGIVKIPNGCSCTVKCDNGLDYKIICDCLLSPFTINAPKTLPPGKEFPNPRDAGYDWVDTRDHYVRTGGLPCSTCGNTTYVFN